MRYRINNSLYLLGGLGSATNLLKSPNATFMQGLREGVAFVYYVLYIYFMLTLVIVFHVFRIIGIILLHKINLILYRKLQGDLKSTKIEEMKVAMESFYSEVRVRL